MRIIGGEWGGRRLTAPKGDTTRPTTDAHREALFNILHNGFGIEARSVLDLFAGTGALGWESLSRGAETVTFVESDRAAIASIEANARELKVPAARYALVRTDRIPDWAKHLKSSGRAPFDLVFCDPPYGKRLVDRAFRALEEAPELFAPEAWLIAEVGKDDEDPKLPETWEFRKDRSHGVTRLLFYRRRGA